MFIAALFTIAKYGSSPVSISRWVGKQLWDIYTMAYYSVVKKKKILPFATVWMGLENIMLSEVSQSDKDKYHMISLICGIWWTNWTNKQNRERVIDGEQMTASWGWGVEGLSEKEKGLMDMDNSVVIAGGLGLREMNGKGEKTQ